MKHLFPLLLPLLLLGCEGKPTRVDFTLNDVDGNRVSFSSFQGKAVVLSFWFLG